MATEDPRREEKAERPGNAPASGSSAIAEVQLRLRALHAAVGTVNFQVAELLGVNRTDLQCLSLLSLHAEMTAGRIAEAMRLPAGTVTTVLDRLEKARLASRRHSDTDQRTVLVGLSPEGHERLRSAYRPLMSVSASNIARFDAYELAVIIDFLTTSVELTEAYTPPTNAAEA